MYIITPVTKAHPNAITTFSAKLSLDGELIGIDELGREVETLLGMKDGASGKLGLELEIELKLGSSLESEVGESIGEDDGRDDGGDDGNSVDDGLEVGA